MSRFHRTRTLRPTLSVLAVLLCCVRAGPGFADEEADRLRLRALTEEGALIAEEASGLRPVAERLAAEGAQLDAADQTLRAEQVSLNEAIASFNAQNVELDRALKAHQAKCPRGSDDPALIDACNAQLLELNAAVRRHEEARPLLQARQRDLPRSIEAYNAARREWATRKREHDPKVLANRNDADYWLGTARTFLGSDAFNTLAQSAGAPAACSAGTLGDLAAAPAAAAVERAYACLQAVAVSGKGPGAATQER